jgi:NAD(P)-dependent dehydrogenase (short-subunit alcohol dehydrogenase family)
MTSRFIDKVVIITGAAGDIGSATAQRFASEGAKLVLVDFDAQGLSLTTAGIEKMGAPCISVQADVTDEKQVADYVEAAKNKFGAVHILFNNAGVESESCDISECDLSDYDRVMAVNVRGVLLGMKYAVPEMRAAGGGSVVNTASVAGLSGAGALATYSASKFAVVGLTRSVAIQQGPNNVRINAICPAAMTGRMMSSIEERMLPDDPATAHTMVEQTIPLGRYAQPNDVASMVTYLCSDEAAFLTGGAYTVDGGTTA